MHGVWLLYIINQVHKSSIPEKENQKFGSKRTYVITTETESQYLPRVLVLSTHTHNQLLVTSKYAWTMFQEIPRKLCQYYNEQNTPSHLVFCKLKLYRPLLCRWNKRQISNWSSVGYLKRVQFYNWFRLHQMQTEINPADWKKSQLWSNQESCIYIRNLERKQLITDSSCFLSLIVSVDIIWKEIVFRF